MPPDLEEGSVSALEVLSSCSMTAQPSSLPNPLLRPGQMAWLSIRDLPLRVESRKLAPQYVGSFKVLRCINPGAYCLRLPRSLALESLDDVDGDVMEIRAGVLGDLLQSQ